MGKRRIAYIAVAIALVVVAAGAIGVSVHRFNDPGYQLQLGEKYLLELKYEKAIAAFAKVIAIEPRTEQAYLGIADAYIGMEQWDMAQKALEQGLEVLPESTAIQDKLAAVRLGPDYSIEWADPVFEQMIRQRLDKPVGDIRRSDLDSVYRLVILGNTHCFFNEAPGLNWDYDYISHSDGYGGDVRHIACYVVDPHNNNVEEHLYTEKGAITRLDDLKHFKNIESIDIIANQINDLSPLLEIQTLGSLNLYANEISDISALSECHRLHGVDLSYNNINDISPLSGLTNLECLYLSQNNINDISPLNGLTNLERLTLSRNNINDISPLNGLTNLEWLALNQNNIRESDIQWLKQQLPNCGIHIN